MNDYSIGFIGTGNMGRSLIGGLIANGVPAQALLAADADAARLAELAARTGVRAVADNAALAAQADVVVLAVKPQVMRAVATGLAVHRRRAQTVFVSVAAGIRTAHLERWLGGQPAIVRAMPNTPALVGSGATALFANARAGALQRERAERVMRAVGIVQWLTDEGLMDAVTAVSGSGPAYYFLIIEIIERTAIELGLPAEMARLFSIEAAFGAAKMALESAADPAALRAQVTSPGGTTERALEVLRARGLDQVLAGAITAACDRSRELAEAFGDD